MSKYTDCSTESVYSTQSSIAYGVQHIANELADLVDATKFNGRQIKEANRLKRREIFYTVGVRLDKDGLVELKKDLEDQA